MPFRRSSLNHRHRDGHVLVWNQRNLHESLEQQPQSKSEMQKDKLAQVGPFCFLRQFLSLFCDHAAYALY